MVGVPGRSKGCITCRKRKKGVGISSLDLKYLGINCSKCDKKVPFCGQCLALGIACEGYDRQPIWLNSEGSKQTFYTKSTEMNPRESFSSPERVPSAVILHDSLARTARAQKYTGLFWSDYLSGGNGFSIKASGTTGTQWIRLYEELSEAEPTLRYVAMALSTATLGANNKDNQLKRKSQQAYGLALQQMAVSLESRRQNKDGILAAIQLMRIYEQLFGTDSGAAEMDAPVSQIKGFRKHIEGETALIISRGPNDTWSSMGRQLLADGRLYLINANISRRERSPFSQYSWKQSQLWRSVTDSPLNKLVDILVEVPGLLKDLDVFRRASNPKKAEELHSSLIKKCQKCEIDLLAWEVEIGEIITVYDYTLAGEHLPFPEDDDDLATIYSSCYYWMTCLMVYSTMGFCELEAPNAETRGPLLNYPSHRIATSYAYRIAHAMHLLFQPPAGDYSAVAALFPLGNALRYLIMADTYGGWKTMSTERLLLVEIFTRPFLGSIVGRFLRNLQADDGIDYGYGAESLVGIRGVEYRARVWWCGRQGAGVPEFTPEEPCFR